MDFLKSLTQVAKDTGRIAVWGSSTIVASAVKKAPAIVEKIHEFANKTEERGTHDYNTYLKNRKAGEAAQSAAQPAPQKAEEPAPQKAEEPAPEAKEPIQAKPEPKDEPEIRPASEQMIEIQAEAKAEEKPAEPAAAEVKPAEKAKETKAKKK
ncbi:MAG: hypothetical protein IJ164_08985 [Duodenibacillus sp.]|nr:hypothetical protein [Duodenibacillus sp.]